MNVAENFLAFRNAYVIDQDQMDSISYRSLQAYNQATKW
jgi:hypothetical protein